MKRLRELYFFIRIFRYYFGEYFIGGGRNLRD